MQRVRLTTILKEKEVWLLILVGMLYFYRPLFLGETFFERDLYLQFFLRKQLWVDLIRSYQLPLWDTYLHGGQPYLAELSNSALYPSNLLFLFLPLVRAFNINIVLHFLACAAGCYLCARFIGLRPVSSLIAGLIYGFCGYTLSLGNLLGLLMAMPYLPLLTACWHRYLLEGRPRWFVLTSIGGVFQVFAGAPETNVLTMLFLLGWTIFYPYPQSIVRTRCVRWILLSLVMLGLASIQIFPTLEMVLQSQRGQGMDFTAFSYWSLSPKRLPEFVFPGFLGYPIDPTLPKELSWWGQNLLDEPRPYIFSIYVGVITILLAWLGGFRNSADPLVPRRIRIFLIAAFLFSVILASGRFVPYFQLVYEYIPVMQWFRFPVKFLMMGILPVALLAGYASEHYFGSGVSSKRLLFGLWGIFVILGGFTLLFATSESVARAIQEFFFESTDHPLMHKGLERSFFHATAIWFLGTLLYHYHHFKPRWQQQWCLAGILMVDLLVAGNAVNSYAPEEFFTVEPEIVAIIHRAIGDGRLYRYPQNPADFRLPIVLRPLSKRKNIGDHQDEDRSKLILFTPTQDAIWIYRWDLEVLRSYLAALYRIPTIYHEDFAQLAQARLLKSFTLLNSLPWEQRLPLLSAGGVTLILTSDALDIPGIRLLQPLPNRSNLPLYLYHNDQAAQRVEFVTDWTWAASDEEALETLLQPDADPRRHVLLQTPDRSLFDGFLPSSQIPFPASSAGECRGNVRIVPYPPQPPSTSFSVTTECDGYLVFAEPFYPGWHILVDDKPTPVVRANYAFSAISLPPGTHKVERFYRPNSLVMGAFISLVFCVVLVILEYPRNMHNSKQR